MIKKILTGLLGVLVLVFVGMQFFNPSLQSAAPEPGKDLMATNPPPPAVAQLLHQACYDCHSQVTRWPWYAHVAPISWWLVDHLNEGREKLNFSDWSHEDAHRTRKRLNRIADAVQDKSMPLPSYTWMHREARLTEEQRGQILKWAEQEAKRLQGEDQ